MGDSSASMRHERTMVASRISCHHPFSKILLTTYRKFIGAYGRRSLGSGGGKKPKIVTSLLRFKAAFAVRSILSSADASLNKSRLPSCSRRSTRHQSLLNRSLLPLWACPAASLVGSADFGHHP